MHASLPGSVVSIASPAVDWDGLLNIPVLAEHLDYFMVMGYDYYWNGSEQAGPVAGLYPMTGSYLYSLSRTLSWYLSEGAPVNKLVMGLPYYGRDWEVGNAVPPSNTIGYGTALTYRSVRNNNSTYSPENLHLEPNSLSPYYSYTINGWHQCFIDNVQSLGMKYNWVKRHNLAGIGIWALGYDNGYPELWDLLRDKFTDCEIIVCSDTLYDSGGPVFNYYSGENYTQTITIEEGDQIRFAFYSFDLEEGHDTLYLFDGSSVAAPLIGAYTGTSIPPITVSSGNSLTMHFSSDNSGVKSGWKAVYKCPTASVHIQKPAALTHVFPNPVRNVFTVRLKSDFSGRGVCRVFDLRGRQVGNELPVHVLGGHHEYSFSLEEIPIINRGVYLFVIYKPDKSMTICKLVY